MEMAVAFQLNNLANVKKLENNWMNVTKLCIIIDFHRNKWKFKKFDFNKYTTNNDDMLQRQMIICLLCLFLIKLKYSALSLKTKNLFNQPF